MVLKKKLLALTLVGVMVLGSSITAFAADGTTGNITGTGDDTGHLDTNVVSAILPTATTAFNFTIDPENILAKSLKIKGTTAVTPNTDLVYFSNSAGGYSASSDALSIKIKNYIDADLSVKAEITNDENDEVIPLAADDDAFAAAKTAKTPTLLLQLKVGDKDGYITADGVTVTDKLDAQADNFTVNYSSNKYVVEAKSDVEDTDWEALDVQLVGKVAEGIVEDELVAPTVKLTWTVAKHVDNAAPSISPTNYVMTAHAAIDVSVDLGVGSLAATDIKNITYKNSTGADKTFVKGTDYTFANGKITVLATAVDKLLDGGISSRTYTVTFDNDATATFTLKNE